MTKPWIDAMHDARQQLGAMSGYRYATDPKGLLFTLARYKFVARMFHMKQDVLEIGCGDGFGSSIVAAAVKNLSAIDREDYFSQNPSWPVRFEAHDILKWPYGGAFDAAYALDVFEHIAPEHEDRFLVNMHASVKHDGVVIIGSPSAESQDYASEFSTQEHVNCKTENGFRETLNRHFRHVFIFGMNDETLTTGFGPMCHYRFGLCVK